jgi:hypothetical protein
MRITLVTALDLIPTVFEWMVAAALLVFAPMAIFRRSRAIAAVAFMIMAPIFSVLLWVSSAVIVYAYWGLAALIVSALFMGVGTVGLAAILTIARGTGTELVGLVLMILAAVGSGIAASPLGPRQWP